MTPFEPDKYYHVYNRGNNGENLFIEDKNYNYFLSLLKKYLLPIANVYAYCLLPNHFHLVIKIKGEKELPVKIQQGKLKLHQPFSNFFNAYSKAMNKQYGRNGSLFQRPMKRNPISDIDYLRTVILYVHLNPVHHEIAEDHKNYAHSSYSAMVSNKPTLLNRKEVIELFDDVENFIYVHGLKKMNLELAKVLE